MAGKSRRLAGCSAVLAGVFAAIRRIPTEASGAVASLAACSGAILKARPAMTLMAVALTGIAASCHAELPPMIGSWEVTITFPNGESHSLRFDAQDGGKGSLVLLDARAKVWSPGKPAEAKWAQGKENSVTFSGRVEFPLGNVGRAPGTLVFKGKLERANAIGGEVDFSPLGGEQPAKHGTFKAARAAGG